ncbi:MAG: TAXI family TRAP transporter solute-binding subunit [Proteobacteria bacterium]|nr:TAXI family TRAP transporter solute-binding subunit [Pseudomonadota bacterium]
MIHYRKSILSVAAAAVVAIGGMSLHATEASAQQRDILIGGGSVTGVYYQVALQTCQIMNKHSGGKYNCVGRPALGSVFNINAVNRGLLDFGVAQSDRNWQAANGTADWDGKPVENLRSVFSAHPEAVLLVTRADAGIKSVGDLKGKTVNIGNPGSGQRGNSMDLLPLYGIDPDKDIKAEGLQQGEASRALVDKKIDAFVYTVGMPSAAIEEPANSTEIDILDINSDAIKKFISDKPYYVLAQYPDGIVKGVDAFETYAVKATVVTSADVEDQVVYDFVKTVFENLEELKGTHAAFRILKAEDMLGGLSAPLHPGAIKYYKEKGLM